MRRNLVAFGALALGYFAGNAQAQELIHTPPSPSHMVSTNEPPTVLPNAPVGGGAAAPAPATTIVGSPVYLDNHGNWDYEGDRGFGLTVGAGALLLQPRWSNNPAYTLVTQDANGVFSTTFQDFSYDVSVSPFFWVGWESCNGLGAKARYWHFDQSSNPLNVNVPAGGTLFAAIPLGVAPAQPNVDGPADVSFSSNLRLEVIDVVGTYALRGECWTLNLSGGARYADIDQAYNVSAQVPLFAAAINSSHRFQGVGPTVAFDARRKLGDSGLSLYGNSQGALLFGSQQAQAAVSLNGQVVGQANQDQDDLLPVLEFEAGVEYRRCFGRFQAFAQVGAVGQIWFAVGNAANSGTLPAIIGPNAQGVPNLDDNANLGFIGLAVKAGITF